MSHDAVELIRKKREGEALDDEAISWLIERYSRDQLPDYQMSAWLMAAFLNGLNDREAAVLTRSMLHSGKVLDLQDVPGVKVDKHSTGGVGDKISLLLAPIVARYDVPVPMISGRGLGHTGGTLDKLESIPRFRVDLDLEQYVQMLKRHRMVLIGQTEEIAPADKRLYALRDVTATVESIPLIASSIMSKKLAEGIDALVLDVKTGSGAFMREEKQAEQLAEKLVAIGRDSGKHTLAYITNMDQPLGYAVGNWLEVRESIDGLQGRGPDDVMAITHQLAGAMLWLGEAAGSIEQGMQMSRQAVLDGSAFEKLLEVAAAQGGDPEYLKKPDTYPQASREIVVESHDEGYVTGIDARAIGTAAVRLGAGRTRKEERIDPAAGILLEKKTGDRVSAGETLVRCYTNNTKEGHRDLADAIRRAYHIGDRVPAEKPMVMKKVTASGVESVS